MIFRSHQILICFVLSVLSLSSYAYSADCVQNCGRNRVEYPFGFSDGCQIKLNCSNNSTASIEIGGFPVQKVTQDQIFVSIPPKCDRPIEILSGLFSENFAPTWRSVFVLENCSSPLNGCVVPIRLARSGSCSDPANNVSCSSFDDGEEFLEYGKVIREGDCSIMLSSIMVDLSESVNTANLRSSMSLEFQKVELGWWLNGNCNCDPNANCTTINNGLGYQSFRCMCRAGYVGDGFAAGEGCRKVSNCNARRYMSGRCGETKLAILIGGIVAGTILFATVIFICYCITKRSTNSKNRFSAKRLLSKAAGNYNIPFVPYKEIEKSTNNFSENQRLGTGAYGTVYAGKLHNFEWVAIKKIRHRDHESAEQVTNEINLLSSVSHPNLVRLLGCCIENGEQILVYEYMPNGTLSQHLQRERGCVLPWTVRLSIAAQTAHAIAHLHSAMNPPIYHRDIKSSNILLDFNFNSKVADFGLSRIGMTDDSHISTGPQGTPGYVDPKYHQNFHLSDKSDVYSFGVVLVEIITAMKVVDFSRPHSEINLAALAVERIRKGRLEEIIDPFIYPKRDIWTIPSIHKVAELAFRCLASHRDMRPSMMEVAEELELIMRSTWAPLEEKTFMKSKNTNKKLDIEISSMKLINPQKANDLTIMEVERESSPVSVRDVWLSEQGSPSSNRLLGNVIL